MPTKRLWPQLLLFAGLIISVPGACRVKSTLPIPDAKHAQRSVRSPTCPTTIVFEKRRQVLLQGRINSLELREIEKSHQVPVRHLVHKEVEMPAVRVRPMSRVTKSSTARDLEKKVPPSPARSLCAAQQAAVSSLSARCRSFMSCFPIGASSLSRLRACMWVGSPRCGAEPPDAEGICASYALRANPATLIPLSLLSSRIRTTALRSSPRLPWVKVRSHLTRIFQIPLKPVSHELMIA